MLRLMVDIDILGYYMGYMCYEIVRRWVESVSFGTVGQSE
jgi:hypothetical protein